MAFLDTYYNFVPSNLDHVDYVQKTYPD